MSHDIYAVIFTISEKLELPVIILALLGLAVLVLEVGAFVVELRRRLRRRFSSLAREAAAARQCIDASDRDAARTHIQKVAWSAAMGSSLAVFVSEVGAAGADTRLNKELADFDFARERRLGRTRLLVRMGPALGLMGTLIPLSPALDGLANGNVSVLTENLRVAFSVTVLGLFIGGVAFALSLTRERMYGQDFSDLEYVAAILTAEHTRAPSAPVTTAEPARQG